MTIMSMTWMSYSAIIIHDIYVIDGGGMMQARICVELFRLLFEGIFCLALWLLKVAAKTLKNGRDQS